MSTRATIGDETEEMMWPLVLSYSLNLPCLSIAVAVVFVIVTNNNNNNNNNTSTTNNNNNNLYTYTKYNLQLFDLGKRMPECPQTNERLDWIPLRDILMVALLLGW